MSTSCSNLPSTKNCATAVMGSQLATEQPDATYEGVLGIWYGKGPGIDRAGDALRHANFTGTSSKGGAIALVGDDPAAKSSTIPSSSDATIYDLHMPLFYPGDVQEVVDLGRHAVALSRMTGLWTSMKIVSPSPTAPARSISAPIGSRSSPPISRSPAIRTARSTSRDPRGVSSLQDARART